MPSRIRAVVALAVISACAESSSPIPEAHGAPPASAASGIAVVELFTSEGCSSCPPADAVLERIANEPRVGGGRVVPLAFHVDYWDGLGWPDPFSSPDYTARQSDYARAFGDSGVYTPQMVVSGVDRFVGSDQGRAEESVMRALARAAAVTVAIRVERSAPDALTVHYDIRGHLADRAVFLVAVVQRSASVEVRAGENAGRTLRHTSIVRAFAASPLRGFTGEQVVHTPWRPQRDQDDVIALVQRADPDAMTILGATTAAIP
jgi:hypothetical protein